MTFFVVPNLSKERAWATTQAVVRHLRQYGAEIVMTQEMRSRFTGEPARFLEEQCAFEACDAVITVGGDGSILHTARSGMQYHKPLLGVNIGRVGFLATIEADELDQLERVVRGEYALDQRGVLCADVCGEHALHAMALNDVVLSKLRPCETVDVEIYCDDTLVYRYQGDGVIFATPTGSTAYSLSAGGPILDSHIAGILVTPICAHSMHSPPMVFSAQRRLRVGVCSRIGVQTSLSCDGQEDGALSNADHVEISYEPDAISLISLQEAEQFQAIDKKLKGR